MMLRLTKTQHNCAHYNIKSFTSVLPSLISIWSWLPALSDHILNLQGQSVATTFNQNTIFPITLEVYLNMCYQMYTCTHVHSILTRIMCWDAQGKSLLGSGVGVHLKAVITDQLFEATLYILSNQ